MTIERKVCSVDGCKALARNKGFYNGKIRYGNVCERHHKFKGKKTPIGASRFYASKNINNDRCTLCGWDKAPCDRHRIDPTKGYCESNIYVLCPNCHKLVTIGLISLPSKE